MFASTGLSHGNSLKSHRFGKRVRPRNQYPEEDYNLNLVISDFYSFKFKRPQVAAILDHTVVGWDDKHERHFFGLQGGGLRDLLDT